MKAAQTLLGHSDFQTTYNIYVGADERFVAEEVQKQLDSRTEYQVLQDRLGNK